LKKEGLLTREMTCRKNDKISSDSYSAAFKFVLCALERHTFVASRGIFYVQM